jgi:molecular chaperone HscB
LTLNGVSIDEEGTIHDPPLLLEIMELREEIEETADPTKLQELKEKNSIKLQDCEKALSTAFGNGDLAGAIPLVQKMTYYDKISEEITRKL